MLGNQIPIGMCMNYLCHFNESRIFFKNLALTVKLSLELAYGLFPFTQRIVNNNKLGIFWKLHTPWITGIICFFTATTSRMTPVNCFNMYEEKQSKWNNEVFLIHDEQRLLLCSNCYVCALFIFLAQKIISCKGTFIPYAKKKIVYILWRSLFC